MTRDGKTFTGVSRDVFPAGAALGSRQWAGDAIYDPATKQMTVFYTATGRNAEDQLTFEQRIAMASATVQASAGDVLFTGWSEHRVIMEPDGVNYQTKEQSAGANVSAPLRDGPVIASDPAARIIYSFRDP